MSATNIPSLLSRRVRPDAYVCSSRAAVKWAVNDNPTGVPNVFVDAENFKIDPYHYRGFIVGYVQSYRLY